jgi:hypothetical protein
VRYFAITAIGTFAVLSATALCAAHVAMGIEAASSGAVRIDLTREAENDRRARQSEVPIRTST